MKELNIPIIRPNQKLVASLNGGLHNPSVLVFNPEWSTQQPQSIGKRFHYPSLIGSKRPTNEEDIAFMSVSLCCDVGKFCLLIIKFESGLPFT